MNPGGKTIRIGTRSSRLAVIQAEKVRKLLEKAHPHLNFELIEITTSGDRDRRTSLAQMGGVGVFVKEMEYALKDGGIDMAVHSAKDLPSTMTEGFIIGAVPEREAVEDCLVCKGNWKLNAIPISSIISTSSPRRRALVKWFRPDLELCEVRGNVETRLRKLKEGEFDGIILARAGLKRLGMERVINEILDPLEFLPAPGQGAIAVEVRAGDDFTLDIAAAVDDPHIHSCLQAERGFLRRLGAGCASAVGGYCRLEGRKLMITAGMLDLAGKKFLKTEGECDIGDDAEKLGETAAEALIDQGAGIVN